jgi:hypothetical protein
MRCNSRDCFNVAPWADIGGEDFAPADLPGSVLVWAARSTLASYAERQDRTVR